MVETYSRSNPRMQKNRNTILRLCLYKNALNRFKALGFSKIFSDYLADSTGTSSAVVRKDFSLFKISGNKRGGYQIDSSIERINLLLSKDKVHKVILVGAGNLGSALMKYRNFEREGMKIDAVFDLDPAKITSKFRIPIFHIDKMKEYVARNGIEIGIMAVPDIAAQDALDRMIDAGIKGVLNFAPIQLKAPQNCIINNVNLAIELENLIYYVEKAKSTEQEDS